MPIAAVSLARGRLRAFTREGVDADALRRGLRGALHDVVAFDAYCVNTADPATLAVTSSVGDGLSEEEAARLFAIEHAGTDVNRLSDLARARAPVAIIGASPERSERMRSLFLPRGWVDELRAALTEHGRCWGYLHLFRADAVHASGDRGGARDHEGSGGGAPRGAGARAATDPAPQRRMHASIEQPSGPAPSCLSAAA